MTAGNRRSFCATSRGRPTSGSNLRLVPQIFEQRNGLISDSSNILTPSSRYTRHNPHPVKILWGSFLRPTKTMRKKNGAPRRLRSFPAALEPCLSLVPRSLPLEAHPCLQRPLSARSAPTGQSMHGMRQDGVPVTTVPADLPGALNPD